MRRASVTALAIFAIVLLSRAPFTATTLWAHDSVLYARAIEQGFHVDDVLTTSRPHPPGYILYVASAALAHAAGLGTNAALVLVSALASALAAAALYLLARRWMRDAVAVLVAVAFAADPLVWQYSEIAYPYTVLALCSIVVASTLLRSRGRGLRGSLGAAAVFGLAAGFRQDVLLLLGPLWIWTVAPLGARRAVACAAALAAACLVWLVPTIVLSDGPAEYASSLAQQAAYVRETYSFFTQGTPALVANLLLTGYAYVWGAAALILVSPVALLGARRVRTTDGPFFTLWLVPPLVVYVAVHIGDWGYVLSALPASYVLAGRVADGAIARVRWHGAALAGATAMSIVAPAVLFAFAPLTFSATTIAAHDVDLAARVAYVREQYVPRRTLIVTREDFLLVRYYLPEFRTRQYDPEPFTHAVHRMRVSHADHVIVFTEGLVPERALDVRITHVRSGVTFVYLDVAPDAVLEFRGERYSVASAVP